MSSTLASHAFWLASRAAGIVALALVSASVLLGLAMAARVFARPAQRRRMHALHQHVALTSLGAISLHGLLLLGDPWLHPGPVGVAVPFTMAYRPLATGAGIVAAYLTALLGPSFYVRRRIGARLWRRLHRLTVVAYALAVAHTLAAGSDARAPWMVALVSAPAAAATLLLLMRPLRRRRTITPTHRRTGSRPLPSEAQA